MSNVIVALLVVWLPRAKHSIKEWILRASWVKKTEEDAELKWLPELPDWISKFEEELDSFVYTYSSFFLLFSFIYF
jgi:hypothetical protein